MNEWMNECMAEEEERFLKLTLLLKKTYGTTSSDGKYFSYLPSC